MLIRCHSCQALFSLQDGVAAAGVGFKVECGRCLNVFEANALPRIPPERANTPTVQRPVPPDPGIPYPVPDPGVPYPVPDPGEPYPAPEPGDPTDDPEAD